MTAFNLKIIALSAMFIDHIGVAFPEAAPFWFRAVGRLAFPIFVYLLAEGFRHTRSKEKLLMRLLVFAAISEIPYDLVMGNTINFAANANIFYTLFLGGVAIWLCERLRTRYGWQTLAVLAAILPTVMVAESLSVDFGGLGVLFIFAMYAIKPKAARLIAFGAFALSQFIPLVMAHSLGIAIPTEYLIMIPFALATVPLVAFYNCERGIKTQWAKWLFYVAYPAHLAVLAIVAFLQ